MRLAVTNITAARDAALVISDLLATKDGWGGLVTVNGPWGSGKTKLVGDALKAVGRPRIVSYNPWRASACGAGKHAMNGLPKEIRATNWRLTGAAKAFERYLRTVPGIHQSRSPASDEHQARLRLARKLLRLSRPMVVVIDDIDRLRSEDAAQVLGFVASTAGLPQLRYLVSFDRSGIEEVLPSGLLDRCISTLQVNLAWGILR